MTLCGENRHPPAVIRPHLFKLLFEPLSVHVDVRERMGKCQKEELEGIINALEAADAALQGEERERRYAGKVSWYERHLTYKKPPQLAAGGKVEEDEVEGGQEARQGGGGGEQGGGGG